MKFRCDCFEIEIPVYIQNHKVYIWSVHSWISVQIIRLAHTVRLIMFLALVLRQTRHICPEGYHESRDIPDFSSILLFFPLGNIAAFSAMKTGRGSDHKSQNNSNIFISSTIPPFLNHSRKFLKAWRYNLTKALIKHLVRNVLKFERVVWGILQAAKEKRRSANQTGGNTTIKRSKKANHACDHLMPQSAVTDHWQWAPSPHII